MEEEVAQKIIGASLEVHRLLGGPGLLENIYESALCHELSLRGLKTQRQVPVPVLYKGTSVREPLFLDVLVENSIILELKATEKEWPVYHAQLLTYLRLTGIKMGFLINFGRAYLKDAIWKVSL